SRSISWTTRPSAPRPISSPSWYAGEPLTRRDYTRAARAGDSRARLRGGARDLELDAALREQGTGGVEHGGRGLVVGDERSQLGELGGRELLLALGDDEVRRRAVEELALLDLEAL